MHPHLHPCLILHIQLDASPPGGILKLTWEGSEAERRKKGDASLKIKQSEQLGEKKTLGDGCVEFSCTVLFPSPKDPDVGMKMMPPMSILMKAWYSLELGWVLCTSYHPQTSDLKSRPGWCTREQCGNRIRLPSSIQLWLENTRWPEVNVALPG